MFSISILFLCTNMSHYILVKSPTHLSNGTGIYLWMTYIIALYTMNNIHTNLCATVKISNKITFECTYIPITMEDTHTHTVSTKCKPALEQSSISITKGKEKLNNDGSNSNTPWHWHTVVVEMQNCQQRQRRSCWRPATWDWHIVTAVRCHSRASHAAAVSSPNKHTHTLQSHCLSSPQLPNSLTPNTSDEQLVDTDAALMTYTVDRPIICFSKQNNKKCF